jgi:hypothetical protein
MLLIMERRKKDYVKIATIEITIAAIESPIASPEPPKPDKVIWKLR